MHQIYFMSLFEMPQGMKEDLDQIQKRFLWGGSDERRCIHWVNWESICNLRNCGGLGFIDLRLKNIAHLNKWLWWYSEENESLWHSVIIGKKGGDNLSLLPYNPSGRHMSTIWKNITCALTPSGSFSSFLCAGLGYLIGNGLNIYFWDDEWIEDIILRVAFPCISALATNKIGKGCEFGS